MAEVILSLKAVRPAAEEEIDSVKAARRNWHSRMDVLLEAQRYWDSMSRFRKDRERNKRYTYGDQWGDVIDTDCGWMTEESYILKQGNVPLKNNLIRRLVRNVLGVYRSQSKEPICTARDRDEQQMGEAMTTILKCNMQLNQLQEVYARTMEEFLISGFAVHRKWYGWRNDRMDCWTDYVQPNNFFIDSNMRDFRGWDCTCLGEVHDVSFNTLVNKFARTPEDYRKLADIYNSASKARFKETWRDFGYDRLESYDFLLTEDPTRCRVIEVWRKETKPRYRCHDYNSGDVFKVDEADLDALVLSVNRQRLERGMAAGMAPDDIPMITYEWFVDEYWYYYLMSPFGDVLDEGETPYDHKSHPYVFKAYPFIDGEIHSFVSDVIDQQRYTNRLITLYDWIMRASAKGVLLVPEGSVPKSMTPEEFADTWTRFNGVLFYTPKNGVPAPQQIANNSTNIGINELLNIQLKFFEDISGVHGALQGRSGNSGTSGTLYAQQAQNAATSLLDLLDSFSGFVVDAAYKDVKNMQQYYDDKRTFKIAGKQAQVVYDKSRYGDVAFDLSITESTNTPVYRQMANDFLMQIWQANQISLEQLLQVGQFPFADELLQLIQSQKEQLQQGQAPQPLPQEMMQQVQQGTNLDAVRQANNAMTERNIA